MECRAVARRGGTVPFEDSKARIGAFVRSDLRPFGDCSIGVDIVAGEVLARGGTVSESIPGKSDTELAIESFVDSIEEIHPNLDREEFRDAVDGCVREALDSAGDGEESDDEEEADGEER
jgi:hypothetical protein